MNIILIFTPKNTFILIFPMKERYFHKNDQFYNLNLPCGDTIKRL